MLCGQAPGVLQVQWKPPILSPTGTSNGANVVGYAVCTKGQRVSFPEFLAAVRGRRRNPEAVLCDRLQKLSVSLWWPCDVITSEMVLATFWSQCS